MTALEHAKRFIRKNAAKTALVIVPLALASQAQASPITFTGVSDTPTASGCVSSTAGSGAFTGVPNGGNLGVSYGGLFQFDVKFDPASGCGVGAAGGLSLTLSGTGTGELDVASIPGHFDYFFTGLNGVTDFSSSIEFFIGTVANGTNSAFFSGPQTPTEGVHVIGNPSLSGWIFDEPPDNDILASWTVKLNAVFLVAGPDASITLNIPAFTSVDILPGATDVPDAIVPEPASLALVAVGGAFLLIRRRARRL